MLTLTVAERETRLSMMGDDHSQWDVFTDDHMWVARLDKIATAYKVNGEGRWYKIPANQVTIKKAPTQAQIEKWKKSAERFNSRQDGV